MSKTSNRLNRLQQRPRNDFKCAKYNPAEHLRDVFVVEDEGVLDVALVGVDVGHADHLHPGAEVAARRHVFVDLHRAALLGQSADALLRRQAGVVVVGHDGGWDETEEESVEMDHAHCQAGGFSNTTFLLLLLGVQAPEYISVNKGSANFDYFIVKRFISGNVGLVFISKMPPTLCAQTTKSVRFKISTSFNKWQSSLNWDVKYEI